MASSTSPLLPQSNYRPEPLFKENKCDKFRKYSSICYPFALLLIIAGCILGLYHPFYAQVSSILSAIPHPFISLEHRPSFHSMNKVYVTDDALADLVDTLPGLEAPPTFAHYSGYVDALEGRQIHYWFFEAQENPETAPLFFWTNGMQLILAQLLYLHPYTNRWSRMQWIMRFTNRTRSLLGN